MTENSQLQSSRKRKPPSGDRHWQFRPGQSGNPGGRPRTVHEVRELAQQHAPHAIARLAELMDSPDPRVAVAASSAMLDRAVGRPSQELTVNPAANIPTGDITPDQAAQVYAEVMRAEPGAVDLGALRFLPAPEPEKAE